MTGAERILAERIRQIDVEGRSAAHDDAYEDFTLARAGACYEWAALRGNTPPPAGEAQFMGVLLSWPFDAAWWKPSNPIRNLEKAGALYLAEADRCCRLGWRELEAVMRSRVDRCAARIDDLASAAAGY